DSRSALRDGYFAISTCAHLTEGIAVIHLTLQGAIMSTHILFLDGSPKAFISFRSTVLLLALTLPGGSGSILADDSSVISPLTTSTLKAHVIERCNLGESPPDPRYFCDVFVGDLKRDLFAQIQGHRCRRAVTLPAKDTAGVVIHYSIAQGQREQIRFVGAPPYETCLEPVSEDGGCDAVDNPFEGLSCLRLNSDQLTASCRTAGCANPDDALCYLNLTPSSVHLWLRNTNNCNDDALAILDYLIAVKAREPTYVNQSPYFRQYLVDPSVVQVPNCPAGGCSGSWPRP
ncbi:MAG: hypothetical protein AAFY88_28290, partial [Acidobacteriota bacterium]